MVERQPKHLLRQEWPAFLDLLDRDSSRAFEEFYLFARRLLQAAPPQILLDVPVEAREDLIHDIILHCCREKFWVLRQYRNRGHAFSAWFAFVAHNKVKERLRTKKGKEWLRPRAADAVREQRAPGPSPADTAAGRDLLDRVRAHVGELGQVCRVLLLGAAEGRPPRELVHLLGWPPEWNKRASDTLRNCRRRLRQRLIDDGLDPDEIFEM